MSFYKASNKRLIGRAGNGRFEKQVLDVPVCAVCGSFNPYDKFKKDAPFPTPNQPPTHCHNCKSALLEADAVKQKLIDEERKWMPGMNDEQLFSFLKGLGLIDPEKSEYLKPIIRDVRTQMGTERSVW